MASAAWVEAVAVSAEVKENSEEVLKVDPRVPYIVLLKGLVETMKWRSRVRFHWVALLLLRPSGCREMNS